MNFLNLAIQAKAIKGERTGSRMGCGRVYLSLYDATTYKTPRLSHPSFKALKTAGFLITKRPYQGTANFVYIGYDNASGIEFDKAEKIKALLDSALLDMGLKCSVECDGD